MAINAERVEVEPSLGYISINCTNTTLNGNSCCNGTVAVCSSQDLSTPTRVSEKKRLFYHRAEIAVLCIVVVIVWMLLSLPILFYHLPDSQSRQTLTCASETYTRDVCRDVLQSQQNCLPDRVGSSDVYISPRDGDNQDEIEIRARTLVRVGLPQVSASPECQEAVVPFLCLYLFPLCNSNGTLYQPSSLDCVTISTGVCEREWMEAINLLGPGVLPQCESLPSTSLMCENVITDNNITTGIGNITRDNTTDTRDSCDLESLECRDGFYINTTLCSCLPRCDSWEQYPHSTVVVIDVFVVLSAAIGLIGGIAVLVISCIRWKRMFVFPSVFTVYLTATLVVFASFVLISYTDRSELYCTSMDLQQSVRNTSTFCTISGVVFYYVLLQLAVWWFFHVLALFWKMKFPFSARAAEYTHYIKCVHFTMVLLAFVLPLVPVIATVATTGFVISRFPALLCLGSNANVAFYSLILPIIVLLQIGITMLIIVFWTVHKQHGLFKIKPSKGSFKIDAAERKLLIVFCYYVILGVVALTAFTLNTKERERVSEEITGYFECELPGIDPENPCDRSRFEALLHPVLNCFSYILLAMFPAINLIYAVNIKELKQWWCCTRLVRLVSSIGAVQSTTSAAAATVSTEKNHSVVSQNLD